MRRAFTVCLSLLPIIACAPVKVVPEERRSPHFLPAAQHLDLGGQVFVYADLDGDVERISTFVAELIDEIEKQDPDPDLARIDVPKLVGMLGLNPVKAIGLSSVRDGAVFRNKAVIQYPGPKQGFMRLLGDKARPFETPAWAPADADLVMEQDVNYKEAFSAVESMIRHVMGDEAGQVLSELDQPIPEMHVSLRQIFDKLDTRIVLVLRVHADRMLAVPGESFRFPYTELALGIDGLAFLFDDLVESFGAVPAIRVEAGEEYHSIQITTPLPGELAIYKPVLAKDKKTGRVFLASSLDLLREFRPGPEALGSTAGFLDAAKGLPVTGNGLTYVSGDFAGKVSDWIKELCKGDEDLRVVHKIAQDLLPEPGLPMASVNAVLPDGLFFASNSYTSHKTTIVFLTYLNPMLLGTMASIAIPAFVSYQTRAEAAAIEAEVPAYTAPPPPAPPASKAPAPGGSEAKDADSD
ncbi:MAG: hypothetical protein JXR96_14470 [Deltaproteobacteria bacterium]|nr:hypothetical protein [Deltaproteobacteria bacterium]